ncbi:MAG: hypothetical protein EXR98_19830 [Gemmataceae bacterium]|nr:hypothetical protein [Gemmataceae bacterium]
MLVQFSKLELATVLSALRYWQRDLSDNPDDGPISPDHFDDVITPLTALEIDDLCQRINGGPVIE